MLIDFILDRKEGYEYDPEELYDYVVGYDIPTYIAVARALDSGTEEDVKAALCAYIDDEGYAPEIKDYINGVNWLPTDESLREATDDWSEEDEKRYGKGFTDLGRQYIRQARKLGLFAWYDEYNGNFGFSKQDYDKNFDKIKQWLDEHPDYGVVRVDASVYAGDDDLENSSDGYAYWLTSDLYPDSDEEVVIAPKGKKAVAKNDDVLFGYQSPDAIKGWWKVDFFDDEGRNLNHWLSGNQIQYFKNREDAVKYIDEVRSWNAIGFTQTLIIKCR